RFWKQTLSRQHAALRYQPHSAGGRGASGADYLHAHGARDGVRGGSGSSEGGYHAGHGEGAAGYHDFAGWRFVSERKASEHSRYWAGREKPLSKRELGVFAGGPAGELGSGGASDRGVQPGKTGGERGHAARGSRGPAAIAYGAYRGT